MPLVFVMLNSANTPSLIAIPKFRDPRGNLSVIEDFKQIPFSIERAYWIYDVPGGSNRHGHAFRTQQELIVALSGCFDVILDNGSGPVRYRLDRAYVGLYVPAMTWRLIDNFATNSVALVLSSTKYDPADYIEDYDQYITAINSTKP